MEAARGVLLERYPNADAAIVGGSVVRGEGSPTSDLDLLVVIGGLSAPFRESFTSHEWPVQASVNNLQSWRHLFDTNVRRRRPFVVRLCSEGVVLLDKDGLGTKIKRQAEQTLASGPPPMTHEELALARYVVTDLLDDLVGARSQPEAYYVAAELSGAAVNLLLGSRRRWLATGKWLDRELRALDPNRAEGMVAAQEALYRAGDGGPLTKWVTAVLDEVGGRLFDGYRQELP